MRSNNTSRDVYTAKSRDVFLGCVVPNMWRLKPAPVSSSEPVVDPVKNLDAIEVDRV